MKKIVELLDVSFDFTSSRGITKRILEGTNLVINANEFHLITGPSGSGKTTLLQIIAALRNPSSGIMEIFNQQITNGTSLTETFHFRSKIGYLFQTPYIPSNLTVEEFLIIQSSLVGSTLDVALNNTNKVLERFDLLTFSPKKPKELSGGEKQRIALASLLIRDIDLLLLDEPTGSLDIDNKKIVWDMIKELRDEKETAIVVVSHNKSISKFADYSYILNYGDLQIQ